MNLILLKLRIFFRVDAIAFRTKFILQKIFRRDHIADAEYWNADAYIAYYAYQRIKGIKEQEEWMPSGLTSEEWQDILSEILFGLQMCFMDIKWSERQTSEFFHKYGINYDNPTQKDLDAMLELSKRRDKALELFGKWFTSLWF